MQGLLLGFATAVCSMLIVEGMMPFLAPARWKQLLVSLAQLTGRQVRIAGLVSMLIGTACLYLLR
ncbi:DUF2065 domain-containing protein [Pseudomonas sp. gcc21]|uniref:DUF2065 domain-containing protein n=1 Tax=Pseudomonas sp. gcc21 TaxID=2726989 RepID=UPI001451CA7D|nr:DUF2065 domain-containing protein [Pseudomonas sp. gcc21]QJD58973.1 DUF2065 domain-containing protein [Pseudomonas sp. gcc21]